MSDERVHETFTLVSGEQTLVKLEADGKPGDMEVFGQSLMEAVKSEASAFNSGVEFGSGDKDETVELDIRGYGGLREIQDHSSDDDEQA